MDPKKIQQAAEIAVYEWALTLQDEVVKITPRDPQRPPKNMKANVTGNLKKSIGIQKVTPLSYLVGVREWFYNTEEYGFYQEYGTIRIPPRSFLRKALLEKSPMIVKTIQDTFNQALQKIW